MLVEAMPAPTPGTLFHHQETGLSGCPACGWAGVPSILRGERQHICPACGIDVDAELEDRGAEKIGRNAPCPCGSGLKHKKCCLQ